jgi:dehydrogenase/reductase SDR family protein 1
MARRTPQLGSDAMLGRSGGVEVVAELAREFGFTEADGSQPPSIRSLAYLCPNFVFPSIEQGGVTIPAWVRENVPDVLLPWSIFSEPPPEAPRSEVPGAGSVQN